MDTNLYEQRTRVQNQLTNTFLKGMDTDTSDMLLGTNQYRYAENVRIVTNTDNNTGELHLIEGTGDPCPVGLLILAANYIRDIAIYIAKENDSSLVVDEGESTEHLEYTPGRWFVYKKIADNQPERVFGPCPEPIWNEDKLNPQTIETIKKSITTVVRYEAPQNIKLYIVDSTGKHSIMVLNVSTTYELDTDNENKFEDVFAYQRTLLPPADIEIGSGSGSITSGKVQYVYRLYSKNGAATPLSVLSKTLSLYKNEYSGYEAEKRSGRSVNISINLLSTGNLDYIQIYRISYLLSGELPKISLVKDEKIVSSFIDTGINVQEDVGISELLAMFTPYIYPKQIESKGDYLFAANMKYSLDDVDAQFKNFDARSYCRGSYITQDGVTYSMNTDAPAFINFINNNEVYLQNVYNLAFEGNSAYDYNLNHWSELNFGTIEEFTCNGYGKNICWRYIYDELPELSAQNQTGKDNKQNYKSTFRCGETYRFGIKLYNQRGQASSVKWIADIIIPNGANIYDDHEDNITKFRNVGIEFIKTPGSDLNWEGIAGWEIVRCERTLNDRKAITLGIIGYPQECYTVNDGSVNNYSRESFESLTENNATTNFLCNPGFFSTDYFSTIFRDRFSVPAKDTLMFASPETCYLQDDIDDILKANKSDLYFDYIYKCYPDSDTEESTWDGDPATESLYEGDHIFSKQLYNPQMSFCFFWPTDHYSLHRSSDFHFIENYGNSFTTGRGSLKTYLDYAKTRFYFNYFVPNYTTIEYPNIKGQKINDISSIESPKYSDFANNELFVYKNNITTISNKQFINWSCPLLLDVSGGKETDMKTYMDNIDPSEIYDPSNIVSLSILYPIGAGGKLMLFSIDSDLTTNGNDNNVPSITVVNVSKNTIPYGGYNKAAIDNSSYISFGDYTNGNSIDVYSGDTRNRIFTYNALHTWYDPTYKNCVKMATVYAIPLETDIDILAQYGLLYGVDNFTNYNIQDEACAFDNYTQNKGSYLYNPAYNATPDIVSWTTPELLDSKIDYFDTRIHYSNVKTNNEDIDNWTQFQASNYLDVDTRFGEITDLKLFKDKLIFWLENATGLLAVNERVVLNDQNDTQVVLGTGGVLERYDYFTTIYGQKKDQHARAVSNDSLYWWDENNKQILMYLNKYDVVPLSTVKNITNYINNKSISTIPFVTYDNKYKEVLFNVVNEESVVYNENTQAFTSIYKFNPIFDFIVNSKLLLTSKNIIYKYNYLNVVDSNNRSILFSNSIYPSVDYVVNYLPAYNKVFDLQTIGGRFYGGGSDEDRSIPYSGTEELFVGDKHARNNNVLLNLNFVYKTPLKQESRANGKDFVTNTEFDFRLTIPRAGKEVIENNRSVWKVEKYGDRLKGKTMKCTIKSNSNDPDFSLLYITTKFRMSWT